MPDNSPQEEI